MVKKFLSPLRGLLLSSLINLGLTPQVIFLPPLGGFSSVLLAQSESNLGPYLMSFHACDKATADCNNPQNHRVYLAQSADGANWTLVPGWTPFPGSVPDVIARGNTLYIYTARGEVTRYDLSTKTQTTPVRFTISGVNEGVVDPSLILDDQGRLVMFFLYGQIGGDPASCLSGQSTCQKRFGSATEVAGSNGTQFSLDSGDRATVTLNTSGAIRTASDPDIFFDGSQFVLYISHGPSISVWTSSQLKGSYVKLADLSNGTGGIPSGHYDAESARYWTYGHTQTNGVSVIGRAVHATLSRTLAEADWATVMSGQSIGLTATTNVESPGFAVNLFPRTLNFAQFGNGLGFTSDLVLTNSSGTSTSTGKVDFFDDSGRALGMGISGGGVKTEVDFVLPPWSTKTISTDGAGNLAVGSARVVTDGALGGVVRFTIPGIGIAGVGESKPLAGFIVPVRRKAGGINTGIAMRNPGDSAVTVKLTLRDRQGQAEGTQTLANFPAGGHLARFINDLFEKVNTDNFEGTLIAEVTGGQIAATALELGTAPGEFTTLPVTPLK